MDNIVRVTYVHGESMDTADLILAGIQLGEAGMKYVVYKDDYGIVVSDTELSEDYISYDDVEGIADLLLKGVNANTTYLLENGHAVLLLP